MGTIATIAVGVALGILIAGGIIYTSMRWGKDTIHRSEQAGSWLWARKLRLSLIAVALLLAPIVIAAVDYGAVVAYEFANSTSGTFSKYQDQRYDHDFDLRNALRNTRWETNASAFVEARNKEHFDAIAADLGWREQNRMRLCSSPSRAWRPAMLFLGEHCHRLTFEQTLRSQQMERVRREEIRNTCAAQKSLVAAHCKSFRHALERARFDEVLPASLQLKTCENQERMKIKPYRPECGPLLQ